MIAPMMLSTRFQVRNEFATRVESIIGAIIEFAGLSHGLLSNGSHSLRNRGVETKLTELGLSRPDNFCGLARPQFGGRR